MPESPDQFELIAALRREVAELSAANAALSDQLASLRRTTAELREPDQLCGEVMDDISTFVSLQAPEGTDVDERQRAEESLREGERRARLIVDSIPGLVAVFTADGELELANNQLHEYFGKTLEEERAWRTSDITHPEDLARAVDTFARAVSSGEPFELEVRARRADGVYRWLNSRALPLRDENGRITSWYNLLVDIDDRKRAEDALRESEHKARLIIDTIPVLAWSARPDGSAEFLNQHYQEFVGLPLEALQGGGWTAAVHPDDLPGLLATWQRMMETGQGGDAEARLRRHDGVYRWLFFRTNPLRAEDGTIVRWYGINIDIEDRKQAEAELRRSHDSFAAAQRLSKTGNFTADVVADTHIWSEELYRIFEFDPGVKVSVQDVRAVLHPEDLPAFDAGFQQSAAEGTDFVQTFRIMTASGNLKHVHAAARVFEFVEKRPVFIGAIRDVTDSKLAEEALNRTRSELAHVARVTALSTLTASIAHEVNQPLSAIRTNAATCLRMLAADPPNLEGARDTARRTIRDGNRASEVIAGLRALFSKRTSAAEVVDLNEAAIRVIALSSSELQKGRVEMITDLADDLPKIVGDRVQLQQVILNLLLNAADAMRDIQDRPRRIVVTTLKDSSENIKLTVEDTGIGIDSVSSGRLFDAFYTTKERGMGIGLSVSRSIIEHHQGCIWAEANEGFGARFSFTLPINPEQLAAPSGAE